MRRAALCLLAIALLQVPGQARSHHGGKPPGGFDYYLLTLSWAPQFCASKPTPGEECDPTKHHGFMVHGLWPENNDNSYPSNCPGRAFDPTQVPPGLASIMPDPIFNHEWLKHGRCTGMTQMAYFQKVIDLWQNTVHIPPPYQAPPSSITATPADIQSAFATASPASDPKGFVEGDDGHYMTQVVVCLSRTFAPQACLVAPNPHPTAQITIRPVP